MSYDHRQTPEIVPAGRMAREGRTKPEGKMSGLAIAAFVFGLLSLVRVQIYLGVFGAIAALAFGAGALENIAASNGQQRGRGWAIAGMVLGVIEIVWFAVYYLFFR
jgi:hypothetical protein